MKVVTFTPTGTKATTEAQLDKSVFEREVTPQLLKLAYSRTLANQRQASAKTKTRGQIRGGGKKPYKQKGTGRARTGSIRNPLWRGGGTIFGPTGEQNFVIDLPRKAIRASLAQALTLKAQAKTLYVIESFSSKEGKVKPTIELLSKMNLTGRILLVVENCDSLIQRSTRNLPTVHASEPRFLTVNAVLNADHIIVTKPALELTTQWLGAVK